MLETLLMTTVPKCDNLLYMETISRKERLAILAGIVMGEGCISARIDEHGKNGKQVDLKFQITNTDVGIIKFCSEVYVENGIGFYYTTDSRKRRSEITRSPVLTIVVDGYKRLQKALSLILPYLYGNKKQQAEWMLQLIAHRQSRIGQPNGHRPTDDAETVELIQRIADAKRNRPDPLLYIRAANQVLQLQSSTTTRSTEN